MGGNLLECVLSVYTISETAVTKYYVAQQSTGRRERYSPPSPCFSYQKLWLKPTVSEFSCIALVTEVPGIGPYAEIHCPVIEFWNA